jgi:hypothetical protein
MRCFSRRLIFRFVSRTASRCSCCAAIQAKMPSRCLCSTDRAGIELCVVLWGETGREQATVGADRHGAVLGFTDRRRCAAQLSRRDRVLEQVEVARGSARSGGG